MASSAALQDEDVGMHWWHSIAVAKVTQQSALVASHARPVWAVHHESHVRRAVGVTGRAPAGRAIGTRTNPSPDYEERSCAICASTQDMMLWLKCTCCDGVHSRRRKQAGQLSYDKPARAAQHSCMLTSRRTALGCPCRRLPFASACRHLAFACWCCVPTHGGLPIDICMTVTARGRWGSVRLRCRGCH